MSRQELNEEIAHLKDQLQELKAKTGLEERFIKKSTQVNSRDILYPMAGDIVNIHTGHSGDCPASPGPQCV